MTSDGRPIEIFNQRCRTHFMNSVLASTATNNRRTILFGKLTSVGIYQRSSECSLREVPIFPDGRWNGRKPELKAEGRILCYVSNPGLYSFEICQSPWKANSGHNVDVGIRNTLLTVG